MEEVRKLKIQGCVGRRAKTSGQKEARESPGDGVREEVALECRQHELHRGVICKLHYPFHGSPRAREVQCRSKNGSTYSSSILELCLIFFQLLCDPPFSSTLLSFLFLILPCVPIFHYNKK